MNLIKKITQIINDDNYLYSFEREILNKALKHVIYNNPSNNLPYHNLNHTLFKLICSFNIYINSEYIDFCVSDFDYCHKHCNNTYDSSEQVSLFVLLLSDLLHDYAHTGGIETDDINIQIAKDNFIEFIKPFETILNEIGCFNKLITGVCNVLDATQYPYVKQNLTEIDKMSRDSDLMSVLQENWFTQIIIGLHTEINTSLTKQGKSPISLKDHIINQMRFFLSITFYTEYANKICYPKIKDAIKMLEIIRS